VNNFYRRRLAELERNNLLKSPNRVFGPWKVRIPHLPLWSKEIRSAGLRTEIEALQPVLEALWNIDGLVRRDKSRSYFLSYRANHRESSERPKAFRCP
jgi:hypothetical protein